MTSDTLGSVGKAAASAVDGNDTGKGEYESRLGKIRATSPVLEKDTHEEPGFTEKYIDSSAVVSVADGTRTKAELATASAAAAARPAAESKLLSSNAAVVEEGNNAENTTQLSIVADLSDST